MVPAASRPALAEAFVADRRGLLRQLGRQLARVADAQLRQARLGRRRMGLHPAERGYAPDPHRAGGARAGQEPAGAVASVAVHHAEQLRRRGRGFRCGRLRLRIGAPVPRQPGGASQRGAPAPRRGAAARPRRHDARHRELRAGAPRQRAELRPRAAPGDARDRSTLHPGRRGERGRRLHQARGGGERQALPDAVRRALLERRPGTGGEPALLRHAGRTVRAARRSVEADLHGRRLRLRLERRRCRAAQSRRSGQLPGDHARGARSRPSAAAAGSRDAQSVHPLDRRGFDRARHLVSRRDHGLQPDAGRASPRRCRPRHLAARRRGSVAVARHRSRRNAPRRRQPPSGPARLRHGVRGHRGDPADHRLPLAGPSRRHRR